MLSSLCVVAHKVCWRAGAAAVTYMAQQTAAVPALRPLVLVVKALLKQWNLNQVFRGGLSSYAAALLMLAHLQTLNPTQTLSGLGLPVAGAHAGVDLGHALLGFLERFGQQFDYEREAVSVRQGGVVPKPRAWRLKNKPRLLAVEDPQVARWLCFVLLCACTPVRPACDCTGGVSSGTLAVLTMSPFLFLAHYAPVGARTTPTDSHVICCCATVHC